MTENTRKNLKALIDLLSDNHKEVSISACAASNLLMKMDVALADRQAASAATYGRISQKRLDAVAELLEAQAARCLRVADEVREIRKNLQIS